MSDLIKRLRKDFPYDPRVAGPPDMELHWKAADEIERLEAENFKLHERVCNAENELSDKNKRNKALRKVIASHKDRLTVASLDLEDDLIAANLGWKD